MESTEAADLANKILQINKSIMVCGIITHTGEPLCTVANESYRSAFSENPEDWRGPAFRAAMMMASAKADDRFFSNLQTLALIRKVSLDLMIWIAEKGIIVVVACEKSANDTEISDKIRGFFGLK